MFDQLQRRLAEIGAPADVRLLADELAVTALRDPLTGVYNRRFFDESFAQQIEAARRYGRELSLMVLDIDRFKQINDTGGHPAGDQILREFARLLQQTVRKADMVCRIGGDEFAVILPETALGSAGKLAERFLGVLEQTPGIRACAGVAALPSEDLFAEADASLLAQKQFRREDAVKSPYPRTR